jgi:hypothetical protein
MGQAGAAQLGWLNFLILFYFLFYFVTFDSELQINSKQFINILKVVPCQYKNMATTLIKLNWILNVLVRCLIRLTKQFGNEFSISFFDLFVQMQCYGA